MEDIAAGLARQSHSNRFRQQQWGQQVESASAGVIFGLATETTSFQGNHSPGEVV